MISRIVIIVLCQFVLNFAHAQESSSPVAENIILITIDGLRPEEFFGGADQRLFLDELGVKEPEKFKQTYFRQSREESRRVLLPFVWSQIEASGWAAGDWMLESKVEVTNGRYFSYPGYNEILTGRGDHRIDSNDKNYNANVTVLEWLNQLPALAGQVLAFCSWDVFPFIINDQRSGIPVNAGWKDLEIGEPNTIAALNYVAANIFREWDGVRYDAFTAAGALQAMNEARPKVLYVALGEPDDWGHAGRYDRYLLTAQQNDGFIRQLWERTEQISQYAGKTAFLITTDHGRGEGREEWKSHGVKFPGSERIWVAAFGAGVASQGVDQGGTYQQGQFAATAAGLLGVDFQAAFPKAAPPLPCAPIVIP